MKGLNKNAKEVSNQHYVIRHVFVLTVIIILFTGLVARAAYLQTYEQNFLVDQGDQRQIRQIETLSQRGSILDRNGEVLAVSSPVDSVWVVPAQLLSEPGRVKEIAKRLNINEQNLLHKLQRKASSQFVYLQRKLEPEKAKAVIAGIKGAYLQREYHRFYPDSEIVGHVTGITNIDDKGQEGLEYLFDDWMQAKKGSRLVLQNRMGEVIEEVKNVQQAVAGKSLQTSIDMRLQYIAYRSLKAAVQKYKATSASAILIKAKTGEILAMVNQPSYNPNDRGSMKSSHLRNRAITDMFEPGSTMKPFAVAAALDHKIYHADSWLNTSPGWMSVNSQAVKDFKDYGRLDITGILRKSSNVGAAKIALSLKSERLWTAYSDYGFGQPTGVEYPGEASGYLSHHSQWKDFDLVTKAFGYGMASSAAQLARAYTVLANDGKLVDLSLLKLDELPQGQQVMSANTAKVVREMLESVVKPGGTAKQAAITGYKVAGKTGTVKVSNSGGYSDDRYIAVFAGMAPASNPELVLVVSVNEPSAGVFYGGAVAAPTFAKIMSNSLRILNVTPDDIKLQQATLNTKEMDS
ncbi:MAG: penicillin-binding protein 2 [Gammaproteobacteria bacterium]|nr:penicillin-binding protein 2 [Gammaproteobacteria bacterium]